MPKTTGIAVLAGAAAFVVLVVIIVVVIVVKRKKQAVPSEYFRQLSDNSFTSSNTSRTSQTSKSSYDMHVMVPQTGVNPMFAASG